MLNGDDSSIHPWRVRPFWVSPSTFRSEQQPFPERGKDRKALGTAPQTAPLSAPPRGGENVQSFQLWEAMPPSKEQSFTSQEFEYAMASFCFMFHSALEAFALSPGLTFDSGKWQRAHVGVVHR